jgi:hypothetical protein
MTSIKADSHSLIDPDQIALRGFSLTLKAKTNSEETNYDGFNTDRSRRVGLNSWYRHYRRLMLLLRLFVRA